MIHRITLPSRIGPGLTGIALMWRMAWVLLVCALWAPQAAPLWAQAGQDRDRLEAFLTVTGFDKALESIALSAGDAPLMLGRDVSEFGGDWTRAVAEIFDTDLMHDMAIGILDRALEDDLLTHAVDFYASDLGRRLVAVENAAHLSDDAEGARADGESIIADLVRQGAPRLTILQRMGPAIDPQDTSVRAVEEIQVRFLLSAAAAGVLPMELDEATLRSLMADQRGELRQRMRESALIQSAHVYKSFSDAELEAYVAALEHPSMQRVYELMNGIQYEIMANRFEVLARRMADLHPGEEL
ncbi:DUF2059 domain-containing protein [Seohaeicola saemankumensis]|uniref:DUF2059 domain-containing protein n=1 Tax=Seohaeicola saemankumensis TaxID=481181 RepID=A0ABW3TJ79_9RHOB